MHPVPKNCWVNELLPLSNPLPVLCCYSFAYLVCTRVCWRTHSATTLCSSTTNVSLHPSFNPPPISISHSIPSPHRLWLLHSSVGTVTRGPTPGWIFEWRNGWMWMDWSRGRETEGGGWPGNDGVLPRQLARRGGADKCHPIWPRWCLSTHLRVDPRPCASTRPVVTSSLPLCLPLIFRHYLCLALL